MLKLPNVTLLAIDCVTPGRTLCAFNETLRHCSFAEVVLLTNLESNRRRRSKLLALCPSVRLVHHNQSDTTRTCLLPIGDAEQVASVTVFMDYEIAVHAEPYLHFETPYVLQQEWDACVINPSAWTDEFTQWDYVGAPWLQNKSGDIHADNNVGNGGFTLKSKNWCRIVRDAVLAENWNSKILVSDVWACRTMRPQFEAMGIRYAPEYIARKFCCENEVYANQFGFHGKTTAKMNANWWSKWKR